MLYLFLCFTLETQSHSVTQPMSQSVVFLLKCPAHNLGNISLITTNRAKMLNAIYLKKNFETNMS